MDETVTPTLSDFQINSQNGVVAFATIAAADIADTDVLTGWIAYKIEED